MGVFATCNGGWLCGPTIVELSVIRPTRSQNSYGEVVLSFSSAASILFDMQPAPNGVSRLMHGQLVEVSFLGFANGDPDIREFDRASYMGNLIEVVSISRYGDHSEVLWKWVR